MNDDNQFTFGENSEDIKTSLVTIDFSNPCSGSKYKVQDVKPMEITVAGLFIRIICMFIIHPQTKFK